MPGEHRRGQATVVQCQSQHHRWVPRVSSAQVDKCAAFGPSQVNEPWLHRGGTPPEPGLVASKTSKGSSSVTSDRSLQTRASTHADVPVTVLSLLRRHTTSPCGYGALVGSEERLLVSKQQLAGKASEPSRHRPGVSCHGPHCIMTQNDLRHCDPHGSRPRSPAVLLAGRD